MGIPIWLIRLFGRAGDLVPCALCRCDIPASDLRKSAAVIIARKTYCRGCVEEITLRARYPLPGCTFTANVGSSSTVFLG